MEKFQQVCIIEDDPIHLLITQKCIELTKFAEEILVYENGKLAFEGFKNASNSGGKLPDVVFLDIQMPIWDGWQFLEEFLALNVETRPLIYLLTSSEHPEDLAKADYFNLRSNYLIKPISSEVLIDIVQNRSA